MQKTKLFGVAGFLAVFLAASILLLPQLRDGAKKSSGNALARTSAKAPVPVITAIAVKEAFTETLKALGTAKANESVVITPTVEERVVDILFDDGGLATKGQVLVKLDDSEARSLLAEARATLGEQQKQFERIRKLAKTNSTSQSKLDEERGLLDVAKARVALLEARLMDYTIRAPFAGILGIRQISAGAVVDSDTVITTLDDTTVIKLDFTVPENYIGVLKEGMRVSAQSPAFPNQNFNATVNTISSRVDPETRTLTVRAQIPNPDRLLKPGMLLTVELIKNRSQSLIIPEEAVIMDKDKKYVLVVTGEKRVEKKEIVTGRRSPGKIEVISGLDAGHQVIISGLTRVRPGSSVDVVEIRTIGSSAG